MGNAEWDAEGLPQAITVTAKTRIVIIILIWIILRSSLNSAIYSTLIALGTNNVAAIGRSPSTLFYPVEVQFAKPASAVVHARKDIGVSYGSVRVVWLHTWPLATTLLTKSANKSTFD